MPYPMQYHGVTPSIHCRRSSSCSRQGRGTGARGGDNHRAGAGEEVIRGAVGNFLRRLSVCANPRFV